METRDGGALQGSEYFGSHVGVGGWVAAAMSMGDEAVHGDAGARLGSPGRQVRRPLEVTGQRAASMWRVPMPGQRRGAPNEEYVGRCLLKFHVRRRLCGG